MKKLGLKGLVIASLATSGCANFTTEQNLMYAPLSLLDAVDAPLTIGANVSWELTKISAESANQPYQPYSSLGFGFRKARHGHNNTEVYVHPAVVFGAATAVFAAADLLIRAPTGESPMLMENEKMEDHLWPYYKMIRDSNKTTNPSPTKYHSSYLPRSNLSKRR